MTPRALATALLGRMTYGESEPICLLPGAEDFLDRALVDAERRGNPDHLQAVVHELLKLIDVLQVRIGAPTAAQQIAGVLMTHPRCLGAIGANEAPRADVARQAPRIDAPPPEEGRPLASLLSPGELEKRRALGRRR